MDSSRSYSSLFAIQMRTLTPPERMTYINWMMLRQAQAVKTKLPGNPICKHCRKSIGDNMYSLDDVLWGDAVLHYFTCLSRQDISETDYRGMLGIPQTALEYYSDNSPKALASRAGRN